MHHPSSFEQFQANAVQGKLVPVYRKLYSDTLTPVTAFYKANWSSQSFLFESVVGGEKVGVLESHAA